MRRAPGFGLATQGRYLTSFVAFCEERGAATVTTDLAVEWPLGPAAAARTFTRSTRPAPYLYTRQEIGALMTAAGHLAPSFRGKTWQALIGLLAVTGAPACQ